MNIAGDATTVQVTVSDDGIGGASLGSSTGLMGLADRVEAVGGVFARQSGGRAGQPSQSSCPLPCTHAANSERRGHRQGARCPRHVVACLTMDCLIVDDNSTYLNAARDLLERQGIRIVAVASSADEATGWSLPTS